MFIIEYGNDTHKYKSWGKDYIGMLSIFESLKTRYDHEFKKRKGNYTGFIHFYNTNGMLDTKFNSSGMISLRKVGKC